jgi:hypothetical protein
MGGRFRSGSIPNTNLTKKTRTLGQIYIHATDFDALLDSPIRESRLSSTERDTLLVIIAALCTKAGIDYRARGAATTIEGLTSEIEARISDDTIRRWINQIPEALGAKRK